MEKIYKGSSSGKKRVECLLLNSFIFLTVSLFIAGCGDSSTGNEPEGPGGDFGFEVPSYGLFLSIGANANGLYFVDHDISEAHKVGDGYTGVADNGTGLTHMGAGNPMIGSNAFALHQISLDGSGASVIGDGTGKALTEGLAYDAQENVLYASSNGFLHIRNPETGETIETVLSPPDQPDIEGLAFDAESRTLYGLARGFESHPEDRRGLFILDVNKPQGEWAWNEVGDTGGLWANAGLAFDSAGRVLYATGRMDDSSALFRINPETGGTTRVGDTGLESVEGGLAWVPAD
jgi:hypothetical protein